MSNIMNIQEIISNTILSFIKKNSPSKTEEEWAEIKYGIDLVVMNLYKILFMMIAAAAFGVFSYLLIAFLSFGAIRFFAGGFHMRKSWSCFLASSLTFFAIIYGSLYIDLIFPTKILLYVISIILIGRYAPADTEEKPYVNANLRKRLKKGAMIVAWILILLSAIVFHQTIIGNILTYSLFLESLFISPLAYKVMGRRYRNYEHYSLD